ncbi:hypothetical protein RB195_002094 [Necator americanus]|uniref:Uncharacterized protein n=1 Tax=Necator americanus TaxID=51031 RepID=A0ABR1DHV5_NECAM
MSHPDKNFENTEQELPQKVFELDGLGILPEEAQGDENVQRYFEEYSKLILIENNIESPFPLKENVIQLENSYLVAIRILAAVILGKRPLMQFQTKAVVLRSCEQICQRRNRKDLSYSRPLLRLESITCHMQGYGNYRRKSL